MSEQLSFEQAMDQNQNMIQEWKDECKQDGYMAVFMSMVDKDNHIRMFASDGMDNATVIRHLRFIADVLEQKGG